MSWSPSRAVFLRRAMINAALTFVGFVILVMVTSSAEGQFLLLTMGLPLVLTLILLLDDLLRWRRVRSEHWEVEEGHLIHDGPDGHAMISLVEIDTVTKRLGNVVIRLQSGQRFVMHYLPDANDVVKHLNTARTN